ncbi:MAG: ubiquinone/menaquinone biosynthesis methyltransferase [Deltaproteobacteria bacterium]|nr:ubiquinone/menaquinone biosynthesis methyltransferase [Deltaproteobacteria bacterium]
MEVARDIKNLFGNISGTYDLLNRVLSAGRDQVWRRKAVSHLPQWEDSKILDLASGTLDMTLQYLKKGDGKVFAVDFSLPMLLMGRDKISPHIDQRLQLACASADQIPYSEHTFDGAMCAWGMRNFPDTFSSLKEIRRVLKPGGKLVVLEFFKPDNLFTKTFSMTYSKFVMPAIGKAISGNQEAYDYLQESIRGFWTRREYENHLEVHGFEIETAQELSGGISSLITATKHAA